MIQRILDVSDTGQKPRIAEPRSPRTSSLSWKGPGLTVFGGTVFGGTVSFDARSSPPGLPIRLRSFRAFLEAFGAGRLPREGTPLSSALRQFFEMGGTSCMLLEEPRLDDPHSAWIGEDGGPGHRTGLHALAEIDEVGSIVLPPSRTPRRRELVLDFALRRPDLFFFLEETGMEESSSPGPVSFPATNVLVFHGAEASNSREPGLGAFLGYLEAAGFKEEVSPARAPSKPPSWLTGSAALRLEAWRRWAGLRRSLDLGTRWIVFEVNHPFLWGRLEREIKAFFYRLKRMGLLASVENEADLARECEVNSSPEEAEGRVFIRVRARLSSPYAEHEV